MEGGIISKQINADINWKAKSHFQSFDMYIYNQNDKWMIQMCQYAGTKLPRTTKTLTSFSSFWHRNETCVAGRLGEVKTQHWKCYIFLPMGNKICALTIRNLQIFLILRQSYWATVAVSISGLCCFHLSTGFLSCLLSTRTLTAYLSVRGAIIFNHVLVLVGLVGFCVGFFWWQSKKYVPAVQPCRPPCKVPRQPGVPCCVLQINKGKRGSQDCDTEVKWTRGHNRIAKKNYTQEVYESSETALWIKRWRKGSGVERERKRDVVSWSHLEMLSYF